MQGRRRAAATKVLDFRRTAGWTCWRSSPSTPRPSSELLPLLAGRARDARRDRRRPGAPVRAARGGARSRDDAARDLRASSPALARGPELLALDERFWQRVLDGAGNLAYQLAFNSLIRAVHARIDLSLPWLEQELSRGDYRRPIAAAIAAGDARRPPRRRRARRSRRMQERPAAPRREPKAGPPSEHRADPGRLSQRAHLQARRPHDGSALLARVHRRTSRRAPHSPLACSRSARGSTSANGPGAT